MPYIYSEEYEYDINIEEHDIMEKYANNKNIPEWLMIKFLLQIHRYNYTCKVKDYFQM